MEGKDRDLTSEALNRSPVEDLEAVLRNYQDQGVDLVDIIGQETINAIRELISTPPREVLAERFCFDTSHKIANVGLAVCENRRGGNRSDCRL